MTQQSPDPVSTVLEDMKSDDVPNCKRRYVRHKADNLVIKIAQIREPGEVPFSVSFFPVRCRDISCGGVSFLLPAKPSFDRVVVQVGDRHNGYYMESEVIHVSRATELPEETEASDSDGMKHDLELGASPYQIGCRFIKRITEQIH